MFFGQYEHTLDEKNRLMIPHKIREEAGVKVYILKGFDGCLSIYRSDSFESMLKNIELLPFNEKKARDFIRAQLSTAHEIDVDKQGRIQIPTQLINKFAISKEVVVIGVGDHFEIWNKITFEKYNKEINDNFESNAESIKFEK